MDVLERHKVKLMKDLIQSDMHSANLNDCLLNVKVWPKC